MIRCLFVSDLHGHTDRYDKLFSAIERERPAIVFLGGDLMPHFGLSGDYHDFFEDVIAAGLRHLKERLGPAYPQIFVILGNDDARSEEVAVRDLEDRQLWIYAHNARHEISGYPVIGYAFVPPTPFLNKDWEKYDVSRFVPVGGVSPEEGFRSVSVDARETRGATIQKDLDDLTRDVDLTRAVMLFHTPPFETNLDRAATDGVKVDHAPLDLHVGSIAVRRFIEERQPLLSLHGHIHESARLTGSWRDRIEKTHLFSAAHDGPELCVVRFDLEDVGAAERILL